MNTPQARPHVDIRSLTPNMYVDGIYAVYNPQVGTTRAGKPYLKCVLRDATGECPARQWTIDERTANDTGSTGFVRVAGHTQEFNGQVQLILEKIQPVEVSTEELRALLPSTRFNVEEMFAELTAMLNTLEHPAIKALAQAYLSDEKLMRNLKEAPAAVNLHHAWIGGLLEHTLQLMRLADRMLPLYPELNRDVVLMGLFLHDLAKTNELEWERGFNYTITGNLIGHIVTGALWLERKIREVAAKGGPVLPARTHVILSHIIISHHNEPEFGAAKRPSTPEAVFVSMLDNLEARTAMAIQHTRLNQPEAGSDAHFTDRIFALDTRLFKANPIPERAPSS